MMLQTTVTPPTVVVDATGRVPIDGAHHIATWVFPPPPTPSAGPVPLLAQEAVGVRSSAGRETVRRRTRWAGCSRPRGGAPSTASAAGRHSTSGTPCSPASSPRVGRAQAR
ncbi:hypothetical protein FRAHR75_1600002 [Frankia sp. Hr75.2]|nr:hypothetical protein FRAHR75_1600002 [Frankia sp. Hr75.2]